MAKTKKKQPHVYRDQESKSLGVVQIKVIAVNSDGFSQFFKGKVSCQTDITIHFLT
jgi:hypothetical protein